MASFAGLLATDLREVVDLAQHPEALARGWWAIAATFEGAVTGYRFADVRPVATPVSEPTAAAPGLPGPDEPAR